MTLKELKEIINGLPDHWEIRLENGDLLSDVVDVAHDNTGNLFIMFYGNKDARGIK